MYIYCFSDTYSKSCPPWGLFLWLEKMYGVNMKDDEEKICCEAYGEYCWVCEEDDELEQNEEDES